jgi:hypothetical protein
MGSGHSHAPTDHSEPTPEAIAARRRANRILAAVLIPLTLLTLAGMAMLWPSGSKEGISLANPYSAAPGVTFDTGTIQSVVTENCMQGVSQQNSGAQGQTTQGQTTQGQTQQGQGPTARLPSRSRTRAETR